MNEYADGKVAEVGKRVERLKTEGAQPDVDRLTSDLSAAAYLHQSFIGEHCNGLLETGY
jgi:hypothetical protein